MNPTHLALTFSVDKPGTLDALEAVLAIARRGGLQLAALQLRSLPAHDSVFLDLRAGDPDLLDLFMARLQNVIGIDSVEKIYSQYVDTELV
jgi:hypothetical protein